MQSSRSTHTSNENSLDTSLTKQPMRAPSIKKHISERSLTQNSGAGRYVYSWWVYSRRRWQRPKIHRNQLRSFSSWGQVRSHLWHCHWCDPSSLPTILRAIPAFDGCSSILFQDSFDQVLASIFLRLPVIQIRAAPGSSHLVIYYRSRLAQPCYIFKNTFLLRRWGCLTELLPPRNRFQVQESRNLLMDI